MTTPQEELLPATRRALLHRIAVAQSEGRAPSLVAAVVRDGRAVWHGSRTSVDGHAPDENVQYRIGSITKTFTAVLVLRLRDEGVLDLGDPLEKHLPGTGAGEATIAELLAHTGGLAAESPGPWWERTPGSLRPELADVLGEQPFAAPGRPPPPLLQPRLHAARRAGRGTAGRSLGGRAAARGARTPRPAPHERAPEAPHAGGWAVHPWADVMLPEPVEDLGPDGSGRATLVDDRRPGPLRRLPDQGRRPGAECRVGTGDAHARRARRGRRTWRPVRLRARAADPAPGRPDPRRPLRFAARASSPAS